MTEQIREGNKLIAEFEGWEFLDRQSDYGIQVDAKFKGELRWSYDIHFLNELLISPTGFAYNSNWNRLMPVVEKITKLNPLNGSLWFWYEISYCHCRIWDNTKELEIKNNWSSTIGAIWISVVQFLKWFNEKFPLPNSEQAPERSAATMPYSSNTAGNQSPSNNWISVEAATDWLDHQIGLVKNRIQDAESAKEEITLKSRLLTLEYVKEFLPSLPIPPMRKEGEK